jgi:hypothetical protein
MRLDRLKMLVGLRAQWRDQVAQVRVMREWVLQTEHILAGQWAATDQELTNEAVGARLDAWCQQLAQLATAQALSPTQHDCLTHFLKVTTDLKSHLVRCYDVKGFPRTNNDMERYIRALKTRYRRVSGRKNWNAYLLRYGRCIAFYDWIEQEQMDSATVALMLGRVGHQRWRQTRAQWRQEQSDQLKMFRFRHKRERFLQELETRWATAATCT